MPINIVPFYFKVDQEDLLGIAAVARTAAGRAVAGGAAGDTAGVEDGLLERELSLLL